MLGLSGDIKIEGCCSHSSIDMDMHIRGIYKGAHAHLQWHVTWTTPSMASCLIWLQTLLCNLPTTRHHQCIPTGSLCTPEFAALHTTS